MDKAAEARRNAAVILLAGATMSVIGFTSTSDDAAERGTYFAVATIAITAVVHFNASAHDQRAASRLRTISPP